MIEANWRWSPPVYIKADTPGLTAGIGDVLGALQAMETWEKRNARKYRIAVKACSAVMEGMGDAAAARRAFEVAADDAGKLVER